MLTFDITKSRRGDGNVATDTDVLWSNPRARAIILGVSIPSVCFILWIVCVTVYEQRRWPWRGGLYIPRRILYFWGRKEVGSFSPEIGGLLAHRTGDTGGMADIGWPICPTSQLLSTSGGDTIPGDPRTYKIVYVGWWQERDMLAHNYVVVEAETRATTPPERIFVRVERDKAGWWRLRGRNLLNEIMTARSEHVLTVNSFRVIFFTLDVDFTHRHEYNLQLLGRLLQIMDEAAPTYILPTVNCWWYSQCSFERLAHRIGADHITAYCQTSLYGFPTPPVRLSFRELCYFCHLRTGLHGRVAMHAPLINHLAFVIVYSPILLGLLVRLDVAFAVAIAVYPVTFFGIVAYVAACERVKRRFRGHESNPCYMRGRMCGHYEGYFREWHLHFTVVLFLGLLIVVLVVLELHPAIGHRSILRIILDTLKSISQALPGRT